MKSVKIDAALEARLAHLMSLTGLPDIPNLLLEMVVAYEAMANAALSGKIVAFVDEAEGTFQEITIPGVLKLNREINPPPPNDNQS